MDCGGRIKSFAVKSVLHGFGKVPSFIIGTQHIQVDVKMYSLKKCYAFTPLQKFPL